MPDIPQAERRTRPEIRAAFEQMFELLVPFFDPDNTWNRQPQLHLAYRQLRENYPHMSQDEINVAIDAALRLYRAGKRPAPG